MKKKGKNHFLVKKNSWTGYKNNFKLKLLKLLRNYVTTKVQEVYLFRPIIFKSLISFAKKSLVWFF